MLNKKNKGITLIALVITIIILLILAGISISMLTGQNGILNRTQEAKVKNEKSQAQEEVTIALNYLQIENETSSTTLTQENKRKILEDELKKSAKDSTVIISGNGYKVNHRKYDFYIDENLKLIEDEKEFDTTEWDKTAAPEDLFIWKSNDPNNSEYGTVIGYRKNIVNYTILKYPTRCTKIEASYSYQDNYPDNYGEDEETGRDFTEEKVRSFTKNILKVEMPNTITEIGRGSFSAGYTFEHCFYFDNLEKIELSKSLESIPSYTFCYCEKLKNIEIPNSVTTIESEAFKYCTGLTDVKIPDSVTSIESYAFYNCTGLTDVKIPDSVTSIGTGAFQNVAHITYAGKATGSPWGAKSKN